MKFFTLETILVENESEEQDAESHFIDRAQQMGFSDLEIQEGLKTRVLEWRDYKLLMIDS